MRPNESLLELLLEVQTLDRVPRLGYLLRGISEGESVTEHSWHLAFLVWVLGAEMAGIDLLKAMQMALVHDLAELRLGDLPRTASRYLPAGAKQQAEATALGEMLAPLPPHAAELFAEYQDGRSSEARLVKACDKLQLMLKVAVYEDWGARGLSEFWGNPDNFPAADFEPVRLLFEELRQRRQESADDSTD